MTSLATINEINEALASQNAESFGGNREQLADFAVTMLAHPAVDRAAALNVVLDHGSAENLLGVCASRLSASEKALVLFRASQLTIKDPAVAAQLISMAGKNDVILDRLVRNNPDAASANPSPEFMDDL